MQAWTRMADWILITGGFIAAFSPSMVQTTPASAGALALVGGVLALAGVINLAAPKVFSVFWVAGLAGLLLFLAPWGLDMMDNPGGAFVAWVIGGISCVVGIGAAVRGPKSRSGSEGPAKTV